ncbi:hypothetical protein EJB05_26152 [Eragrostis curvula]|uniref:Uncharacterized protein n=1 Tax=Eragrostis curvula TaxID=38414 RepID=A0A5J9UKD3_9POAL|nr:hypothetical protein EJB05_26152 [Eragrostis curvula]
MEDAVDDFTLRVAGRNSTSTTDANSFKKILAKATAVVRKAKDGHKISDNIKDIKKLSSELAELRAKYTVRGAGANLAATTGIDPRVINLYKKESDLVGIEETRGKVIRMLIGAKGLADAPESLKIVSIVGVAGLGKTTLAKTVHDAIRNQFQCCAFVSVGRTPNLTKIFEKMLVELDEKYSNRLDMAGWDLERFSKELHIFLENKRYFIVVDDVWDQKSWEDIKYALMDNVCRSRIIMTTRNLDIASKAEDIYTLKALSDENSKKLFYKRIQSQEGGSIEGLSAEVSSKIIDKCGGIPLAIIAIASLLVDKPCEDWSKVYDSIDFGNGDNTMKIMSYSYHDLPSYLKPCLLHLSIFPEDFELDPKSVIWMWIGEGFVNLEKEGDSLFEVGERYFNELVNRSMIQHPKEHNGQLAQTFRVHDIVFDLIYMLSKDENFVTVLGSKEQQASLASTRRGKKPGMPRLKNSKVRRLAIQNHHVQHIPEDTMDMPEVLRSLNIVNSEIENMVPLHSFKVCRVLFIQESNMRISLNYMGRLLHLKYIDISYTPIDELPKEIGHLKSLRALQLIETGLDELPPAVCSLRQLLCLIAVGFKRLPADRMGKLTSLEELRLMNVVGQRATKDLVVELGKLTRLRVVAINFSEELGESLQKSFVQSLCNLGQLQELIVYFERSQLGATTMWESWVPPRMLRRLLIAGIRFLRLPRWINSSPLPHLYFISLDVCVVEIQDLDNLARLPELRYLNLGGKSWPPGYSVGIDGFKNLRSCLVGTALKFHPGAAQRLEELHFTVYPKLDSFLKNGLPVKQLPTKDVIGDLDFGLDNLLSLEQVTISIFCFNATATEVQGVEAVVSRAVEDHPNHPTINVYRLQEEDMCDVENVKVKRSIGVLLWKDESDANFIRLLSPYPRLQEAVFSIYCEGASMCEVEKVEAALTRAAEVHPNHPTIEFIRENTEKMLSSSDHPDTELDDHNGSQENSLSRLQLGN